MGWKEEIELLLSSKLGGDIFINSYSFVGGGSINETFVINTNRGHFFVKKNSASRFPDMFKKEVKGISILAETNEILVPEIIGIGESNSEAFLILENIESGLKSQTFWDDFGQQLAKLHSHSVDYFGLDHDNYIGSLVQKNSKHDNWTDFFKEERLEFQLRMARNSGIVSKPITASFDRFFNKLDEIFPKEQSSLLHGDLWGGNFMVSSVGEPIIIDPAVYYGHREMDLGMTQLFGGFDKQFYVSYNRHFPLESGWEQRLQYCNLYPLLVHVNLFGGSYLQSISSIIGKF